MGRDSFTLEEVGKLVKNAYETGFCDGEEPENMRMYIDSNDFWVQHKDQWINSEINYVN